MRSNKLLGITIPFETKSTVLEKILKYIDTPTGFFHIVSLNPENSVITTKNKLFKKVYRNKQLDIWGYYHWQKSAYKNVYHG